MKLNLKKIDKQQAVELATAHVEKVVFGAFALVFLLLCLGALKQKAFDKTPAQVQDKANQVRDRVERSAFDPNTDVPDVPPPPEEKAVPERVWVTHQTWNEPPFDVGKRRPEPKFLALQDLHVATSYGAIAMRQAEDSPADKAEGRKLPREPAAPPGGALKGRPPGVLGGAPPGAPAEGGGLLGAARGAGGLGGIRGPGLGFGGGGLGPAGPRGAPQGTVPKGKQWVVITGLVPWEAQNKEYRTAFRNVGHPRGDLDTPHYHDYEVQRREIVPGSAADGEEGWQAVDVKLSIAEEANFADLIPDLVPQRYTDPVFTLRLPHVLGKEHDKSVAHPKIPLEDPANGPGQAMPANFAPRAAPPMAGGLRGGLMGSLGGRGGQGPGAMPDAANPSGPKIEYKLFRFFDYTVQPGKSYRYRVRLVLDNPNYHVPAQYLTNPQLAQGETRPAPWSEASPVVAIPRDSNVVAGGVKRATGMVEQKAEVVVRKWDQKGAVDAARIAELSRGQVANFPKEDVAIDDPLGNGNIITASVTFATDTLVVDITGGDPLTGAKAKSPGQLLVLEPTGQLTVKSELADLDTYETTRQHLKDLQDRNKPAPTADDSADDKPSKKKKDKEAAPSTGGLLGGLKGQQGKSSRGQ